ncbi:MAG: hypothetical protein AB7F89_08825, partial [Pirellulaceae bacterium]
DGTPSSEYGSWRTGENYRWTARGGAGREIGFDPEVVAAERQNRAQARSAAHREAAERARRIWDSAIDPDPAHQYLRGKAIRPIGIRRHRDALVVPMRDVAGRLWSLQFIAPDGRKRFLRDGRTKGLLHAIGARTPRIWLCEGYATGASLHQDLGDQVLVAFTCGNLEAVAEAVLQRRPPHSLTIMGDDDHLTPGNPGITAAKSVAEKFGLQWFRPEFPPNRPTWSSDYNDASRLWATARKGAA